MAPSVKLLCCVLLVLPCLVSAKLGVDVSQAICAGMTLYDWTCHANSGKSFAVIEVHNGGLGFNTNVAKCVNDAWAAGFDYVDLYIFMCPKCRNNYPASDLIKTTYSKLQQAGLSPGGTGSGSFGMLWFDVEQCTNCWGDVQSNAAFVQDGVNTAKALGLSVGAYSSVYEWQITVGTYSGIKDLPLWYAHYDGVASFADGLYKFGGWTKPAIKQYADHASSSCKSADSNWYPDSMEAWWNATHTAGAVAPPLVEL